MAGNSFSAIFFMYIGIMIRNIKKNNTFIFSTKFPFFASFYGLIMLH
jgi:hypothetical protein